MNWQDVIPYGLYKDDYRQFRHSIDKLIVYFPFREVGQYHKFCDSFSSLSGFVFQSNKDEAGYNSYFDKPACNYYGWYSSAFWFPHCNVKFGAYYRTTLKTWAKREIIKVEFNPNKIYECQDLDLLIKLIKEYCYKGILLECDYAVDVPFKTFHIISKSFKDKIIYNDSRYYGKRHNNGRLKIYNKARELYDKEKISIDSEISRCEVTCLFDKEYQMRDIQYCTCETSDSKLSKNLRSIADLIILASSYGEDREELLKRYVPDKRNRDMLQPVLFGTYEYIFDPIIFAFLIGDYSELYYFDYRFVGNPMIGSNRHAIDSNGGWSECYH